MLVRTDPSILNPLSADVSVSVLGPSVHIYTQCINGASPVDNGECLAQDGPGVVDVGATGVPTFPTTTGLLLKIGYRVAGNTSNTPIDFATGCSGSSDATGSCVFLNDTRISGASTIMPATIQPGSFEDLPYTTGDFAISTSTPSISTLRGMTANANVSLNSIDGFTGTLSLEVRSSTNDVAGWMDQSAVTLLSSQTFVSKLTFLSLVTATPGIYTVTIVASIGSLSHSLVFSLRLLQTQTVNLVQNGGFDSHFAFWQLWGVQGTSFLDPSDPLKDKGLPAFQVVNGSAICTPDEKRGTPFAQMEDALGSNGFLEQWLTIPSGGARLSFHTWGQYKQNNPTIGTVVIVDGIENRFTLDTFAPPSIQNDNGSCNGASPVLRTFDLSGFAGQTVRLRLSGEASECCSALIMYDDVQIVPYGDAALPHVQGPPDFALTTATSEVAIVGLGQTVQVEIDLVSLNSFSGNVSLQVSFLAGLNSSLNATIVNLQPNATKTVTLSLSHPYGSPISEGWIEVSGSNGSLVRSAQISVNLGLFLSPDFVYRLSPSPIVLGTSTLGSATIHLTSLGGFAKGVSLSAQVLEAMSNNPTATVDPNSVTLASFGSATSDLTVSIMLNTPVGNYTILLKGTNDFFGITHYMIIPLIVENISPPHITITTLSCSGPVAVHSPSTCVATVKDVASAGATAPTGIVSFTTESSGSFSGSPCSLIDVTSGSVSCKVTYTPSSVGNGIHAIEAVYSGDSTHSQSYGYTSVRVTSIPMHTTITGVTCFPSSVSVGSLTTCTATVTDTDARPTSPEGTLSFSSDGYGSFEGSTCTLSGSGVSSTCAVIYAPSAVGRGAHTVTAIYSADATHAAGSGYTDVPVTSPSSSNMLLALAPWAGLSSVIGIAIGSIVFVRSRRSKTRSPSVTRDPRTYQADV